MEHEAGTEWKDKISPIDKIPPITQMLAQSPSFFKKSRLIIQFKVNFVTAISI
jgi:hypothetical protein